MRVAVDQKMIDEFALIPASYVYLLRTRQGHQEVLLQLRQNTGWKDGHWAAGAAGHVDRGETAVEAALREAREEIGVEISDLRFEACMQQTRHAGSVDERVDFYFSAHTWTGTPRIMEPERCGGLRWFSLNALPDSVVDYEMVALRSLGTDQRFLTFGF